MKYAIDFSGTHAMLPFALQQAFEPLMYDQRFMATASLDRAICVYSMDEWDSLALALQNLPAIHYKVRQMQRLLLSNATIVEQDCYGQINLPKYLKQHAGIRNKAVAIPFNNKFEIWNSDTLNAHLKALSRDEQQRELFEVISHPITDDQFVPESVYPHLTCK